MALPSSNTAQTCRLWVMLLFWVGLLGLGARVCLSIMCALSICIFMCRDDMEDLDVYTQLRTCKHYFSNLVNIRDLKFMRLR